MTKKTRLDAPPLSLRELDRPFRKMDAPPIPEGEPHLKPVRESIVMNDARRAAAKKAR